MNWKQIAADIRNAFWDWYGNLVWTGAHARMPDLRMNRIEMRMFMLCLFSRKGPAALNRYDVVEVLAIRDICGRRWFDYQLIACDEGHVVTDPFRTLV